MKLKKIDKYILKSLFETFIFGIVAFASILLASEAFLDVIRQISKYGIDFNLAMLTVALRLPGIVVYTIPMALLVAVILTYNKLSNNLELTALRSSGVSLYRLAATPICLGIIAALLTLFLNEMVVPKANYQAKNIMLWAIIQKNMPKQKNNFVYKDLGKNNFLRRLFYIDKYENNTMYGVILIDLTNPKTTKIIQADEVKYKPDMWEFHKGTAYTVSTNGKLTNTSSFDNIILEDPIKLDLKRSTLKSKELNYFQLAQIIQDNNKKHIKTPINLIVQWHEKFSIPFACILVALIGMPLAISPPRSKFNRGFGFSVIALFLYYLLKATSTALGEIGLLDPFIAAWLPNIIVLVLGLYLLHRKNYC